MHSWEHGHTTFLGHSDLSGDVTIHTNDGHVQFPFADLLDFVANQLGYRIIDTIERGAIADCLRAIQARTPEGVVHVPTTREERMLLRFLLTGHLDRKPGPGLDEPAGAAHARGLLAKIQQLGPARHVARADGD